MESLIVASLKGETTPVEEERLAAWRKASSRNDLLYHETVRLWALVGGVYDDEVVRHVPGKAELTRWAGVRPLAAYMRVLDKQSHRRRWLAAGMATAAALLIGLALAQLGLPLNGNEGARFGAEEFVTGDSESATVALLDGTVVRLAPSSRLRVVAESSGREVVLDGRAYFAVAKQNGRPFRVHTAAGDVQVLGTRFEVRVEANTLRLVVVEGGVSLTGAQNEAQVVAGEMSGIVNGVALPAAKVANPRRTMEWLGNFIAFQATPLAQTVAEVERTYGVEIRIADPRLRERTVTGWYVDRPFEEIMRAVCLAVLAECSMEDGALVMESI